MEVILLERIRSLGQVGDKVNVKSGYARNYLVPYKKAVLATKENVAEFEQRRAELEKAAQELLQSAQDRAKLFDGLVLKLSRKAAEDGKLFGSVGIFEVIEAFRAEGKEVTKSELIMPVAQIRSVGEYEVVLDFHSDVALTVKVIVEAE